MLPVLDLINVVVPVLLLMIFFLELRRIREKRIVGPSLYLLIFASLSSNFALFYRQLGQILVFGLCIYVVLTIIRRRKIPTCNRTFLFFGVLIAFSLIANGVSNSSLSALINFVVIVLVVNLIFLSIDNSEKLINFMRFYGRLALVLSIAAIFEWSVNGARAEGTFSNPNYLGFFLGPATCAVLCLPITRKKYLVWAIIALGVYATGSRAALLFLPTGFIASLWIGKAVKKISLAFLSLLLVLVFAVVPLPSTVAGRDQTEGSDIERLTAIEVGIQMTRENPVTGIGWGDYVEEFRNYLNRAPSLFPSTAEVNISTHRDMVSHNDLVRVFSELGVVAGCYFLFVSGISLWRALRSRMELRGFLTSALVPALFFSFTHNNLNNALFWILLLFPMSSWVRSDIRTKGREKPVPSAITY